MTYFGISDFDIAMAEKIIEDTYGDTVSVADKKKTLLKFGKTVDAGTTKRTVARLGSGQVNETYATSNLITHVSSSSGSDTGPLRIEYHTVSGSGTSAQFTFGVQDVTLAGQTKTALTTPAARVSRMYRPSSSSTDLVGDIYAYEDVAVTAGVPGTATAIHAVIPAGENQTFKCATTISNSDYWIITAVAGSVYEKANAYAELRLEVRDVGGVFLPKFLFGVSSGGGPSMRFEVYPPVIVPKNADVRMTVIADGAGTDVSAWANGYLAAVQ